MGGGNTFLNVKPFNLSHRKARFVEKQIKKCKFWL
jgi:hypothetical protein